MGRSVAWANSFVVAALEGTWWMHAGGPMVSTIEVRCNVKAELVGIWMRQRQDRGNVGSGSGLHAWHLQQQGDGTGETTAHLQSKLPHKFNGATRSAFVQSGLAQTAVAASRLQQHGSHVGVSIGARLREVAARCATSHIMTKSSEAEEGSIALMPFTRRPDGCVPAWACWAWPERFLAACARRS